MYMRVEKYLTTLISFSGIDGAGKSTQIQTLRARLTNMGLRIEIFSLWNDVARLTRIRKAASRALFRGGKGVGTPSAPVERQDKNVRPWFMTCMRMCLYFLDALSLRIIVRKAIRSGADVVIFDRYIFDELANLTLQNPFIRSYVQLLLKLVPKPHISFLLDADPIEARSRKPEYPIEFLHLNRQSYLALSHLVGGMTILGPMPICDLEQEILKYALEELSFAEPQNEYALHRSS
jgi:thymidylate kinase